jgi:hypothetical protein
MQRPVQATANIPIDGDKECWEKEDHARHVWGIQADPLRVFHFVCPGRDVQFQREMMQLKYESMLRSSMAHYRTAD